MKGMVPRRSSFLKRLFFSYILLLIPLFAVYWGCTARVFENQCSLIAGGLKTELSIVQTQFESELQNLTLRGLTLSLKDEVSKSRMYQNGTDAKHIMDQLKDIRSSSTLVSEVFLWYGGEEVYSSVGMSRLTTLGAWQMGLPQSEITRLEEWISEEQSRNLLLLKINDNASVAVFYQPIPVGNEPTAVNFTLNMNTLGQWFNRFASEYDCTLFIEFSTGDVVEWTRRSGVVTMCLLDTLPETGKGVLCLQSSDMPMGLTIRAELKESEIYEKIWHNRTFYLLMLAVLLLAGLTGALLLSMRNAKPIRLIAQSAVESIAKDEDKGPIDEIDAIGRLIEVTRQENQSMQAGIIEARRQLLQQTMLLLCSGGIADPVMVREVLAVNGQELVEKCYAVALLSYTAVSNGSPADLAGLSSCTLSAVTRIDGCQVLAVLIQTPTPDEDRVSRAAFARRLRDECRESGLRMPSVFMGRPCEALEQVNQAYIEAVFTFKTVSSAEESNVYCFEELIDEPVPALKFDPEDMREFSLSMEEMDGRRLEKCVRRLLNDIQSMSETPDMQTLMRYHLIRMALRGLIRLGIGKESCAELLQLDPTAEEPFSQRLVQLLKGIFSTSANEAEMFTKAVEYINGHYTDQGLTLEEVAARLGQNKSVLSRVFKSQSGMRYIDYLSDLRMRKAAQLLEGTDFQIKEITQQVGYWDPVSFQKKFKMVFGVNPSEYRTQHGMKIEKMEEENNEQNG